MVRKTFKGTTCGSPVCTFRIVLPYLREVREEGRDSYLPLLVICNGSQILPMVGQCLCVFQLDKEIIGQIAIGSNDPHLMTASLRKQWCGYEDYWDIETNTTIKNGTERCKSSQLVSSGSVWL